MLSIKLFPAEYGDCIMLSIGKENQYNILIDGGLSKTYQKHIKSEIQHIKEKRQKIGLLVCFLQVLFAESCKLKIQNVALWKIHSFAS